MINHESFYFGCLEGISHKHSFAPDPPTLKTSRFSISACPCPPAGAGRLSSTGAKGSIPFLKTINKIPPNKSGEFYFGCLEGIEPSTPLPQSGVLPLNYRHHCFSIVNERILNFNQAILLVEIFVIAFFLLVSFFLLENAVQILSLVLSEYVFFAYEVLQ